MSKFFMGRVRVEKTVCIEFEEDDVVTKERFLERASIHEDGDVEILGEIRLASEADQCDCDCEQSLH